MNEQAEQTAPPLLEVEGLKVRFGTGRETVRAVDGVQFHVNHGESVGLVGESGCGKSTLGKAVLRLLEHYDGTIRFEGVDIRGLRGQGLRAFREKAQMVFQDPYGSLNPRMSVGRALQEVLMVHGLRGRAARRARAEELFRAVGLDPLYLDRYPHEFSGGQRQRIGIARALAAGPSFIIADEPVSALDVSVQVQILNLMKDLQKSFGLAYLFVAHDLAVVRYICSRIMVMYLGKVVESGPADEVYEHPAHPYTKALLSSVPDVGQGLEGREGKAQRIVLRGDVPSATAIPPGCPFHTRCPVAVDRCRTEVPALREVGPGRRSACHFAEEQLTTPELRPGPSTGGRSGTANERELTRMEESG